MPNVCVRCVADPDLKAFIRQNADDKSCDFCGRSSTTKKIAVDADLVVAEIEACLDQEYEDAAEMVPVEGGEYVFDFMSSREILEEHLDWDDTNEAAFDYFVHNISDKPWVQKDFFSQHLYDSLKSGWEEFARATKHQTRYLFFPPRPDADWPQHDEIRPEEMLDELGRIIRKTRLVKKLKAGTKLYRVRRHDASIVPTTLLDLGPPPIEHALQSNRMSPAGISMLYAATDRATAITESADPNGSLSGTLATLRVTSDLRVVDFVNLPRSPSVFTPGTTRNERAGLHFVHAFAREVSRPITRDDRERIEYVPTQVVTEYLRYRFRTKRGAIDGVRYSSARGASGSNVALFVGHEDLEPGGYSPSDWTGKLELVERTSVDISAH